MAQHCIHCGSAHRAAAKVCPTCGRAVEADSASDDDTRAVPTPVRPGPESSDPIGADTPGALIPPPPPPPPDDDPPPAAVPPSIALPGGPRGSEPTRVDHRAAPTAAGGTVEPTAPAQAYSSSRPNPVVIVLGLLVVLGAGIGAYLFSSGDDDGSSSSPASSEASSTTDGGAGNDPSALPSTLTPMSVTATAERQTLRGETCTGKDIAYTVDLLVDGDEQTGWGAGEDDGTGESATLDFGEPVRIATIAMTPGYTKIGPRSDNECRDTPAFPNNRWVTRVEYRFDDGTTLVQDFVAQPTLQSIDADVVTRTVTVTILGTERPPGADDDTIISELRVAGTPVG